ncbi:hypothetical protein [Salinispora tropica]|uniref:Uncharacterized protein n=1 Tax=Salinispora tropica (strain ATCC BAA-916 / DSM 44818 / JCM 13857 / NBRC 105044 / CNB-440) TaxID=369723 RepID=A4X1C7_SALTO|nr:hypothetical protein [Salinispora tropica]ABP52677.1 hypothetical protein Strop_0192 [Salinispora tropica CNB-440]
MRKALTLVVTGLVAAMLGILSVGGLAAATTATEEEAAVKAQELIEKAKQANERDPYAPEIYGSR